MKPQKEKTNEIFGLFKNMNTKNDILSKDTFSDMLDHIRDLDVRFVGDSKREVVFGGKKESPSEQIDQEHTEDIENKDDREIEESLKVYSFDEFIQEKLKDYGISKNQVVKNVRRFETEYTKSGKTFVSVMKTHSKHRLSSKLLGSTKENSYSLSINGEHLVSRVKGEEGKPLVNPKISELYWNFLTELGELQIKRKRNNIKTNDEYDTLVGDIKDKYRILLSKLK